MIISSRHFAFTILIAVFFHIAIAIGFSMPKKESLPLTKAIEKPSIKIDLLATVAEKTVNAAPKIIQPPIKEKKQPVIKKKIIKKKTIKKTIAKTKPKKNKPIKTEAVKTKPVKAEPIQEKIQPTPVKSNAPLNAIATARYEQLLVAWLEKYKKYPRRAKRLRIEGEAQLRIIINRTGHTQLVVLAQATGNRFLDKAALDMAKRANPFPSMPKNDPREQLEFIVPVTFLLN